MSVPVGDVLGLTAVFMPSGFNVAVVPPPPAPVDRHGTTSRRRAPTYHPIAVRSLIPLIGVARPSVATPIAVESSIEIVSRARAQSAALVSRVRTSTLAPLAVRGTVAASVLGVESRIVIVSRAKASSYNEADVRFVLGLP